MKSSPSTIKLATREKLRLRCLTLTNVVKALQPVYAEANLHATQRDLIETLIGAAVWYLPSFKAELWTGHVSVAALRTCDPSYGAGKVRLSEEHLVPRKLAGAEMLIRKWTDDQSVDWLEAEYMSRFGRFCYVTPSENKELTKLQKAGIFRSALEAYTLGGIEFVKIAPAELLRIRRRDGRIINEALLRPREFPL